MSRGQRGDEEVLFLAEGRPIKRKTYCTGSNACTDAPDYSKQLYSTIRLRSVCRSHNERLWNALASSFSKIACSGSASSPSRAGGKKTFGVRFTHGTAPASISFMMMLVMLSQRALIFMRTSFC